MPFGGALAAGLSAVGAGAGIASSLGLFGGGGSAGGASPAAIGSLNPSFNVLLDLFGSQFTNRRTFKGVTDDPNNPGIFGGNDFKSAIQNLTFGAPGLTSAEGEIANLFLNSGKPGADLARAQSLLGGLVGNAQGLTQTGFRTSALPAYEEAVRQFRQNILPDIAEIAGQRTGVSSGSFLESANRAASDLLGQAALQQVGLNESAAQRRAAGLPVFGSLIGTQLGLQPAFANDLLALGGSLRNVTNAQQSRPLDVLSTLSGLGQGQQFIQAGFNPAGSGTTQLLQGLSATLPGIANGLTGTGGGGTAGTLANLGGQFGGSLAALGTSLGGSRALTGLLGF